MPDLAEVEKALRNRPHADLYETGGDQALLGSITLATIWEALSERHEQADRELARMPVVETTDTMRLTVIIHAANIIQAYNDAARTARREEQGIE